MNTDAFLSWVVQLLLILTRMSSFFVLSPLMGRQNIPAAAKVGLALLTSFILINFNPPPDVYPYAELMPLALAVLSELIVGLVMGFITILFFNIVYAAGHIIDMQIGFSMAQVFDPVSSSQVPVAGSLLNLVLILSFVASDGVTNLMAVLARSFTHIPVGGAFLKPELAWLAAETFSRCFILSINVAMPVLAAALLTEVALGIVVRTAPQMNVFVIGIPIKIIIGLLMFSLTIPIFTAMTGSLFEQMYGAIELMFGGMAP